jgi:predicted PurR-regulated permease PerM
MSKELSTAAPPQSPPWGRTTKLTITVIALLVAGLLVLRFSELLGQFVIAAMLAYMLNPLVELLARRTRLTRGWAVMITYLLLLIVGAGFVALVGVAAYNQGAALADRFPAVIRDVTDFLSRVTTSPESQIKIGPLTIQLATLNWTQIEQQLSGMVTSMFPQGAQAAGVVVGGTVSFVAWISITLLVSIYIAIDLPRLGGQLGGLAQQSGYRNDYNRLARGFNRIWNAYLRGQVILGIIIAIITSIMLAALGVENWLALGLLTGVLQVIPYVGPTVSAVLIVLFALFQPSNYLGLSAGWYALLVGGVTLVVQQVSGNILLPRVVGDALNMSALAVLISLIIGYAVAGVLGVILAAPVVASLKLIVNYVWRKLLDLPPFPDKDPPPTQVTAVIKRTKELMRQIRNRPTVE